MKIDPVSLHVFVAVMEEGTIAAAAERVHLAPAAASKRIAELESALDVVLFERSNKGMLATNAARVLLGLARGVLNGLGELAEQMAGFTHGTRGHVRVAANISAITQFLPDDLRAFTTLAPAVQIHLQEQVSSTIARGVAEGSADIGILNHGVHCEGLTVLPYRRDELILIAPRDHPLGRRKKIGFKEALAHDFVGAHTGSAINDQLQRSAAELGMQLRMRVQVTSFDAMALMVAAGMGVAVLPRVSARLFVPSLRIRMLSLDEPWAQRQIVLCVRSLEALSPAARMLADHLRTP